MKNKGYADLGGGANKVHYGRCASGVDVQVAYWTGGGGGNCILSLPDTNLSFTNL